MIKELSPELKRILTEELKCEISLCGSQKTCYPAPYASDTDYLCFCSSRDYLSGVVNTLFDYGYHWEGDEHYQDVANGFMSWRNRNNINIIVTKNPKFHQKHKLATKLCERLNLLNKDDRVLVFQTLLYGNADWRPKKPADGGVSEIGVAV